jgi:hypothetical protein
MRRVLAVLVTVLLALPAVAAAKLSRNYLVQVYAACPGSGNCPAVFASQYTFDSAVLYSSPVQYTAAGKLALKIVVKGLKDPSGAPFTGKIELRVGASRVTILAPLNIGTLGENSPLAADTVYVVNVTNGNANQRFNTPPETPESGLRVNTFAAPVLYDPDGHELASTGTRTKE